MNQQLEELMYHAGLTASGCWDKMDDYAHRAIEKFAELIVKKCAYLVNHQQRTTGYTAHAKMLCEEFEIEFKEEDFFGVEE
jgi:hypothetical protein